MSVFIFYYLFIIFSSCTAAAVNNFMVHSDFLNASITYYNMCTNVITPSPDHSHTACRRIKFT